MAADWQIGDLALCIKSGNVTREGTIYTVAAVHNPGEVVEGFDNPCADAMLAFVEDSPPPDSWSGAERFRKIRPDKHEACEPEFVTLLKRKRVSA